jgi:hypothetical protein
MVENIKSVIHLAFFVRFSMQIGMATVVEILIANFRIFRLLPCSAFWSWHLRGRARNLNDSGKHGSIGFSAL